MVIFALPFSKLIYMFVLFQFSSIDPNFMQNGFGNNLPEWMHENRDTLFWSLLILSNILFIGVRSIVERILLEVQKKSGQVNQLMIEISKLAILDTPAIFGLLFCFLFGFEWIFSLFFIVPFLISWKLMPWKYIRDLENQQKNSSQ